MAEIVRARDGWEEIYDHVLARKENLEAEKEEAKQKAFEEIEARFADESARIDAVLEQATEVEFVPDDETPAGEGETEQEETAE